MDGREREREQSSDGVAGGLSDDAVVDLLESTLAYAREREYTGWDYYDGMSARVLDLLPVENRWVNLAVQEGIKRFPVNVRPLCGVEQRRNFKGTALFAMANLTAAATTGEERYREEADDLVAWLLEHRSRGAAGFCGGHQHALQGLHEKKRPRTPGIVSTSYAMRALLAATDAGLDDDGTLRDTAASTADVVVEDLDFRRFDDHARVKYFPDDNHDSHVVNANAIAARTLLELADATGDDSLRERSELLYDYVVSRQYPNGGWKYADPASNSHLSMDNHHNGFVVESLLRYRELTGSERYAAATEDGLQCYRTVLFEDDGAPNWDETAAYPRDIHAAAQGIVVFSLAGDHAFARRIIDWTVENLYAGGGQFYYQQRRFYTKQFTLMRWCQAWMAFALATYLRTHEVKRGR